MDTIRGKTKKKGRSAEDRRGIYLDNSDPVLARVSFNISTPEKLAQLIAVHKFPAWVNALEIRERGEVLMWRFTSSREVSEAELRELHEALKTISAAPVKLVTLLIPEAGHLTHVYVIKSDNSFKSVDISNGEKVPAAKSGPRPVPASKTALLERTIEDTLPPDFGPWKAWLSGIRLTGEPLTYAQIKVSVPDDKESTINTWSKTLEERLGIPVIVFPESIRHAFEQQLARKADSDGIIRETSGLQHYLDYLHGEAAPDPGPPQALPFDTPGLVDMREAFCFSLDPLGAADIDDVIHAKRQSNGDIRLLVSFADVSWRVTPGSQLDDYAKLICFSQYGRLTAVPMLGPELSFDELSLKEGQDRMAFSVSLRVTPNGQVLFEKVFRSVVRNHCQGSYEEFDELLRKPDRRLQEVLSAAMEATARLQHSREGQPNILKPRDYGSGYSMVSEAMIAAKHIVARDCWRRSIPILYRVQTEPTYAERVELLRRINESGIEAEIRDLNETARFGALLQSLRAAGHTHLFRDILDILDRRALYYAMNRGHFGLALDAYADIKGRHYAGLLTQRQLGAFLAGQPPMSLQTMKKAQRLVNRKERARYDNLFRLLVLEEAIDNLSKVGRSFSATLQPGINGNRHLHVAGFRHAYLVTNRIIQNDSDSRVDDETIRRTGEPAIVKLEGWDVANKAYVFSLVSSL